MQNRVRSRAALGCVGVVTAAFSILAGPAAATRGDVGAAHATMPMMPIEFVANHGQTDARVKFMARVPGGTLFLAQGEAVFAASGLPLHGSLCSSLRGPTGQS